MLEGPAPTPENPFTNLGRAAREDKSVDCEEGAERAVTAGRREHVRTSVPAGRAHGLVR